MNKFLKIYKIIKECLIFIALLMLVLVLIKFYFGNSSINTYGNMEVSGYVNTY